VGLFSQPFFDVRLLDIYLDQLKGIPFFAGLSPVTSDKSMSYWEDVNQVVFPENFKPTLSYNVKLSQDCLESAKVKNQNAYLMPIRIKAQEYLSALWEPENTTYST
jgi:methylenetetrahydrofolate reductase (NADPH)